MSEISNNFPVYSDTRVSSSLCDQKSEKHRNEWECQETLPLLRKLCVFKYVWEQAVISMTPWKKGEKNKAGRGHGLPRAEIHGV